MPGAPKASQIPLPRGYIQSQMPVLHTQGPGVKTRGPCHGVCSTSDQVQNHLLLSQGRMINPKLGERVRGRTCAHIKLRTFPGPAVQVLLKATETRLALSLTAVFCPFCSPECFQHTNISPLTLNPALLPLSNSINIYDV